MIVAGAAFLLFGALVSFFKLPVDTSAFVTGVVLIVLGLVVGERFPVRR
jgi:hypothetical protein